jgi:hypothetical protein
MYTLGKQTKKYNEKTKGESFLFTLNVTNTMAETLSVQLFNVIKSVIYDGTTQNGVTFTPFTINGVETIVAGTSSVGIQTTGNLYYKNYAANTYLNVQAPTGQNLTYRDIFTMISAGQYLQLSRITITSSLKAQLTTGTLNVVNISNLGVVTKKSVPLVTFFDGTQNQNNILDVFINTELCKNQGLEFTILPNSTATIQFYLEA